MHDLIYGLFGFFMGAIGCLAWANVFLDEKGLPRVLAGAMFAMCFVWACAGAVVINDYLVLGMPS